MIHAYDEMYLHDGQLVLARMLDFAVYDLKKDLTIFFEQFIDSGLAARFEHGDCSILAGKSGIELAHDVQTIIEPEAPLAKPHFTKNRSPEYWTGWALAYYQWETGLSFCEILQYIPLEQIMTMYYPYHEMDIRHFVDEMNRLYSKAQPETNLKRLRKQAKLSQGQLADISEVPVRTIQQYEQRQKHINNAKAETLMQLAQALCCEPFDLIEKVY